MLEEQRTVGSAVKFLLLNSVATCHLLLLMKFGRVSSRPSPAYTRIAVCRGQAPVNGR